MSKPIWTDRDDDHEPGIGCAMALLILAMMVGSATITILTLRWLLGLVL